MPFSFMLVFISESDTHESVPGTNSPKSFRSKPAACPLHRNLWVGAECLNLLGINNVNSYYWITDVTGQQYAVPNYLTGRQINVKVSVDF